MANTLILGFGTGDKHRKSEVGGTVMEALGSSLNASEPQCRIQKLKQMVQHPKVDKAPPSSIPQRSPECGRIFLS
ncbi:hypothetical protein HanPSC8_Chr09g0363581 [Helianthus annuus]|nr:hypothetical protein HanPSC8_Chr09g0363581 [Helianthus annuus]